MTLSALNIFVIQPPGFSLEGGGGGTRDYVRGHTTWSRSPKSLYGQGPGLAALDPFLCYLSLTFKHSDTKWDKKYSQILRGGGGGRVHLLRPFWICNKKLNTLPPCSPF